SGFLKKNILRKGYTTPTPIQDQAILHIIEGKDVIGIANTGTGKTAAFLIPLINKVMNNKSEKVLIITPTRELAVQIDEEFRDFSRGMGIYAGLCIGGANFFKQRAELRRKPHFVIGTPGRIREFIQEDVLDLSQFHSVVLDEADRMVDIGFINDIKYFISLFPVERQSLFFSATIEKKEKEILQAFVKEPVTVSVKKQDTAININQEIIKVENKNKKIEQLHDLLIKQNFNKVLIFGRTKWGIQKLTEELIYRGFKAGAIHGNKSQSQRQRILDQFKKDEIQILLATDVASRGLDINNVSHVINYDMPASYEDYIHRIGRTGRAEKKGTALTFVE
ncbi:MAG TPA: DEAD/DEAH box helicase, partial [Candidatus Nitrosocosmicus sp.]|nr:DEAD/DEAH box helicase [Candidatus Nitrosocosmicus sp.]